MLKCISATFLTYRVCFLIAAMDMHKQEHFTGIYDLVSMLTHKGRSADSGHYVAWVKQENCELHQSLSNCIILSELCQLLVLIPLKIRLWLLTLSRELLSCILFGGMEMFFQANVNCNKIYFWWIGCNMHSLFQESGLNLMMKILFRKERKI